jgi:hypothetical protein
MVAEVQPARGLAVLATEPGDVATGAAAEAPVTWRQCGEVAVTSAGALALAVTIPLTTTVFALLFVLAWRRPIGKGDRDGT